MALAREQKEVEDARDSLGETLDAIEQKFHPSHIASVASWWVRRSARKHPVAWTAAIAGTIALVVGVIAWAVLDDSDKS